MATAAAGPFAVDDFVIDPTTWAIRHLLIDTSNWIGGRAVLIEPASVTGISWDDRTLSVAASRDAIVRGSWDTVAQRDG